MWKVWALLLLGFLGCHHPDGSDAVPTTEAATQAIPTTSAPALAPADGGAEACDEEDWQVMARAVTLLESAPEQAGRLLSRVDNDYARALEALVARLSPGNPASQPQSLEQLLSGIRLEGAQLECQAPPGARALDLVPCMVFSRFPAVTAASEYLSVYGGRGDMHLYMQKRGCVDVHLEGRLGEERARAVSRALVALASASRDVCDFSKWECGTMFDSSLANARQNPLANLLFSPRRSRPAGLAASMQSIRENARKLNVAHRIRSYGLTVARHRHILADAVCAIAASGGFPMPQQQCLQLATDAAWASLSADLDTIQWGTESVCSDLEGRSMVCE